MSRTTLLFSLGALLLASCFFTQVGHAQETSEPTGQLTVPWDEFKQLLHLEEDQIVLSLQTFQKLLAQTGQTVAPQHTIQDGNVVLTRAVFQQLVNQMRPPTGPGAKPPFNYLMTKAIYSGKMRKQNTAFTGTFHVHVLAKDVYLKIPLLPQSIALEDVTVDGEQALVVSESGYHQIILATPGEHVIETAFSLKTSLDQGPQKIDLAIQQTPITLLRLEIPLKGIEVEIPQAQQIITDQSGDGTIVSAVTAPGNAISVRWRDKAAVVEKIPPKLYSDVHHLVSIEDDVLKISTDINYNILHSEIDNVRLSIPEGINVLSVTGEGVGEWQELGEGTDRQIRVPFTYGRKGGVTIRVSAEKPLPSETGVVAFSGLRVLDSVRETGFIGIEVKTSAEVTITERDGLEPVAVQKLPQQIHARAVKPLMHGFKYLKHPYNLVLAIRKHEKIAVPVATINSASAVTLFTEDGKVVHRLVYQVRNSAKQFLEVAIPEQADIWTVFVDNQPVESAINGKGDLLVPLIRSRTEGNRLSSFPVEIVYALVEDRFSGVGSRQAMLPAVDLLTSQLMWSVYLPNNYTYIRFSSTLEKERMIRALNLLSGAPREYDESAMKDVYFRGGKDDDGEIVNKLKQVYKGQDYRSEFSNQALSEEQMSSQVTAELEFGRRMEGLAQDDAPRASVVGGVGGTGVMPIQIQVPTGGQVYRFAKTIIKTEDPLTMKVTYGANLMMGLLKWIILFLIALILYLNRRIAWRILVRIGRGVNLLWEFSKRHEGSARRIAQSVMTPVVLLGLLIPSWLVSRRLAAIVIFLLWLSVIYQLVLRSRRRAKAKADSHEGESR